MSDQLEFRIHGMDSTDEVAISRRAVGPIVGAPERLSFDVLRGKMIVRPDSTANPETITAAVAATGMRAEPWRDATPDAADTSFWQRRRRTILTVLSGILALIAFVNHGMARGWLAALGSEGVGLGETVPPVSIALYVGAIVRRRLAYCSSRDSFGAQATAGHESVDDGRRHWRGCHRRMV